MVPLTTYLESFLPLCFSSSLPLHLRGGAASKSSHRASGRNDPSVSVTHILRLLREGGESPLTTWELQLVLLLLWLLLLLVFPRGVIEAYPPRDDCRCGDHHHTRRNGLLRLRSGFCWKKRKKEKTLLAGIESNKSRAVDWRPRHQRPHQHIFSTLLPWSFSFSRVIYGDGGSVQSMSHGQ